MQAADVAMRRGSWIASRTDLHRFEELTRACMDSKKDTRRQMMKKTTRIVAAVIFVLGCGIPGREIEQSAVQGTMVEGNAVDLPIASEEPDQSPYNELTASCGPSNFTVPCGTGYCPSSSTCLSGKYCACLFGYSYNKCSGDPCSGSSCSGTNWWCEDCQAMCRGRANRNYCISIISRPASCGSVTFTNTCPFDVQAWFQTCVYGSTFTGCTILHNLKPHEVRTISGVMATYTACQ